MSINKAAMNSQKLLDRIDFVIQKGIDASCTGYHDTGDLYFIDEPEFIGFRLLATSLLTDIFGETHFYCREFEKKVDEPYRHKVYNGCAILEAIKAEIENGWLTSIKQLVSAEIFVDFLEMAEHLLENNYKDAAAVMIGSVLEEHLRQLCSTYDVEITVQKGADTIPLKADQLNADLKKQGVYTTLEQKNVTAWLDLRNKAAHGKYNQYTIEQVKVMYLGVLNFVSQFR